MLWQARADNATGRSREGAWIEMAALLKLQLKAQVAPVRERGLKYYCRKNHKKDWRRSREGAWIEIHLE